MREPSFDAAMAWARAGMLSPIPADTGDRDRLAERMAQCRRDYPEVFELLLDLTLRRSPVDYRLPRHEGHQYATLREGQNQVMASILDYLDHAERLQDERRNQRQPSGPVQPDGFSVVLPRGDTSEPEPDLGDALFGDANRDPFARV